MLHVVISKKKNVHIAKDHTDPLRVIYLLFPRWTERGKKKNCDLSEPNVSQDVVQLCWIPVGECDLYVCYLQNM